MLLEAVYMLEACLNSSVNVYDKPVTGVFQSPHINESCLGGLSKPLSDDVLLSMCLPKVPCIFSISFSTACIPDQERGGG